MIRSKSTFIALTLLAFGLLAATVVSTKIVSSNAHGAQSAPKRLEDFKYGGASLAPYTSWRSAKGKRGKSYFLLAREAAGADRGTYDAFGGARDSGEKHVGRTAAREAAEETINLLGSRTQIEKYIDIRRNNTKNVVANERKRAAVFITSFDHKKIDNVIRKFYQVRKSATSAKYLEKDSLALVQWESLKNTIANVPRDSVGRLITPIQVTADVIAPHGPKRKQKITLRPFFVSVLQDYFKGSKNCVAGKNKKVKFCS